MSLSWLHLTDLHQAQGMTSHTFLWPQVEHLFFQDLGRIHDRAGPFDLVLFTGDLTQRGSSDEFQRLEETLERLYQRLRQLGSVPQFLAVPGNHDLVRPSARDPAVRLLCERWLEDGALREEFFADPTSVYRQVVAQAFANFTAFSARHHLPRPAELRAGLLPGDFAATLRKDGLSVGILGLNSAFLQLSASEFLGRLALHPLQFHAPCDGDGPSWAAKHDLCLLLSHHPPAWLSADAQRDLAGEIATPGRFAVHLFGHMHEHSVQTVSSGGGAPVRRWQGCSLFGLESFGDEGARRSHGYAAGRIEVTGGEARLRIWPRRAVRDPQGPFRLVPDYQGFDLDDDHGTRPERFATAARPEPDPVLLAPPRPGAPYHKEWYVPRPKEERIALSLLRAPGAPVLLWGATGCGKSWLLGHLLAHVRGEDGPAGRVVSIDLGALLQREPAAYDSLDAFVRALCACVATALGGGPEWVDAPFRGHGGPGSKLNRFMEQRVLPAAGRRLVLALDGADALLSRPFGDDFFGFLRAWADDQEDPWLALRLVLVLSITPAQLTRRQTQSPLLNRVVQLHLRDFDGEQVGDLVSRHGLRRSRRDVPALMARVGGNPYLLQTALSHAAVHGLALKEFDKDEEVVAAAFAEHLRTVDGWLKEKPELLLSIARLLAEPRGALDKNQYDHLHRAGLLSFDEERGYRVPYRLYEDFLRNLCPKE